MKKLWEIKHPYYCQEGNFYSNECLHHFDSWAAYMAEWGDADPDMNFVWRFDWKSEDGINPETTISIFIVSQRKAILQSCEVVVKASDHDKIYKYLEEKSRHVRLVWAPFLLEEKSN